MKLLYPPTKSAMAFHFSVERMFSMWPNQIYFWTFTWVKVQPDWRYTIQFHDFSRELYHRYGGMVKGLRVVEVHPGEFSHGLHVHALLNQRVHIRWVLAVTKKYGIGRVDCRKAKPEQGHYLAKYMTKESDGLSKGMRRWGTIGGWRHTKVKDIEVESQFHDNMREVQNRLRKKQLTTDCIHTIYLNSTLHGAIENWPLQCLSYSNASGEMLSKLGKQSLPKKK